jgi:hypothetical protein
LHSPAGLTGPQPLGNLAHRLTPIIDLSDRIALERICEICTGHYVLLASKIIKQDIYKSRGKFTFHSMTQKDRLHRNKHTRNAKGPAHAGPF